MKKAYIIPALMDYVEIDTGALLQKSGYDVNTNLFEKGQKVDENTIGGMTEEELLDLAGARQRGGDFGSLW